VVLALGILIVVLAVVLSYRRSKATPAPMNAAPASTLIPQATVVPQPAPEPVKEEMPPAAPEPVLEPAKPIEAPAPPTPAVEPVVEKPVETAPMMAAQEPVMETAPVSPASEPPVTEKPNVGKFELYKDNSDKFRFRLKARNGEIIAVGEAYESKEGCLNGIESMKENAPTATIIEVEPAVKRVRSTKPRTPRTTRTKKETEN
jgi:uncharacterized protein YegP (UPF0339 family)